MRIMSAASDARPFQVTPQAKAARLSNADRKGPGGQTQRAPQLLVFKIGTGREAGRIAARMCHMKALGARDMNQFHP
jgi:hypothetical protein